MHYRPLLILWLVLFFFCVVGALLPASPAQAANSRQAVFDSSAANVVVTADEVTAGDGCSLREAIGDVFGPSADCSAVGDTLILLPAVYTLSRTGDGALKIQRNLTITVAGGGSATIQGGPGWTKSIIFVSSSYTVAATISNVTLQGSAGLNNDPILYMASVSSTVAISNVTLRDGGRSSTVGGGIFNLGEMSLYNTIVFSNTGNLGGGIYNLGVLTATDSTIISNTAQGSPSRGGGIFNLGTLILRNSDVISNVASNQGGGIFNDYSGAGSGSIVTLRNVTLTGNVAAIDGGAVYNNQRMDFNNATIAGNTAPNGGGVFNSPGSTVFLTNTVLAGNSGDGDCRGLLTSGGFNLVQNKPAGSCTFNGSYIPGDPHLGPLQDNGGPTLTLAIIPPSPLLEGGDNATCEATDQRGMPRPQEANCDIGAFEYKWWTIYLPLTRH